MGSGSSNILKLAPALISVNNFFLAAAPALANILSRAPAPALSNILSGHQLRFQQIIFFGPRLRLPWKMVGFGVSSSNSGSLENIKKTETFKTMAMKNCTLSDDWNSDLRAQKGPVCFYPDFEHISKKTLGVRVSSG